MSKTHGKTFPSEHAFVKLNDPEVMSPDEPNPTEEKTVEWMKYWLFRTSDLRFIPDPRLVDYVAEYKRCKRKEPVPWKNLEQFIEILFPTRYWVESGIRMKQKVSMEQVTRDVLKEMSERLDNQLTLRQSQFNSRYCAIRYDLHMELFDELIRQVTLNDPMRAFMLERVRGELNQTLDAYKKVLETSLVEESKFALERRVDPEVVILTGKLEVAQAELEIVMEENENATQDFKEIDAKFELMERIQRQVHEPEIALTKRLGVALERQLYHFDNPPTFETGDEDE